MLVAIRSLMSCTKSGSTSIVLGGQSKNEFAEEGYQAWSQIAPELIILIMYNAGHACVICILSDSLFQMCYVCLQCCQLSVGTNCPEIALEVDYLRQVYPSHDLQSVFGPWHLCVDQSQKALQNGPKHIQSMSSCSNP